MTTERPFQVDTRMFGGNAGRVRYEDGDHPGIVFSSDPKGAHPLWFYFRIKTRDGQVLCPDNDKLHLILEHYDTLAGVAVPTECCPVYKAEGQFWIRLPSAKSEKTKDGRCRAIWTISHPTPSFEFALCYPYEGSELNQLIKKSRGGLRQETIGLSSGGRDIRRLANSYETSSRASNGLYIVARECGCDMPAGWFLDGLLQRLLTAKHNPYMTWAVPVADPDGARSGNWYSPPGISSCWNSPLPRHENHVIQTDMLRWKSNCNPRLALAIRAAELKETSGIYCEVPCEKENKSGHEQAVKWAHVMQNKLGDYASPDFVRTVPESAGRFYSWASAEYSIPALTLCIPWASAGSVTLSPKKYREAAKLLTDAILNKK